MTDIPGTSDQGFAELAGLISVVRGFIEAQRNSDLMRDGRVVLDTSNNPVDFTLSEMVPALAQAAMVENTYPVPVLVGFDAPAVPNGGSVITIPAYTGRVIPRPHTRLSIGCDPALASLVPTSNGIYVARYARFLQQQVYALEPYAAVKTVAVANPAAGADWSVQVPAGVTWEVQSVYAQLATSAVVANRFPVLVVQDAGGNTLLDANPGGGGQTATQTHKYTWAIGAGSNQNTSANPSAPIPDMVLPGGSTIGTTTLNLDAGDQWSAVSLFVVEYTS